MMDEIQGRIWMKSMLERYMIPIDLRLGVTGSNAMLSG